MRVSFFVVVGACALGSSLVAQPALRISGRVVDSLDRPVAGVRITLEPTARSIVSEEDGRFVFNAVPSGAYRLRFVRIGFRPATEAVTLDSGSVVLRVALGAIPAVLDSVLIRERTSGLRYRLTVVESAETPVSGASVEIIGRGLRLSTDSTGNIPPTVLPRGTVMLRIRKVGYSPLLSTLRLLGERDDTLRLNRLAQSLAPAEILARSGFGRDTFVFRELTTRMSWRSALAGVISREELDAQGRLSLCDALPYTPTGAKLGLNSRTVCSAASVLINGERQSCTPLTGFYADQVEAVEYYPPGGDWSGTIVDRITGACGGGAPLRTAQPSRRPGGFVIWLRPGPRRQDAR